MPTEKETANRFEKVIKPAFVFKSKPSICARTVIFSAVQRARDAVKKAGRKRNIKFCRIPYVPLKVGRALPFLIPMFSGLSVAHALAGGAARIAKAVNYMKSAGQ